MLWILVATVLLGHLPQEDLPPGHAELKGRLTKAIRSRDWGLVQDACQGLVMMNSPQAMDILVEVAMRSNSVKTEEIVGHYVTQIGEGPALERLCHLCNKHPDVAVRDQLTMALAVRPEMSAYRAVLTSLYDRKDSVIMAACHALRKKKNLGCIRHLIRALQHQEDKNRPLGAVAYDIRDTLDRLTGYEFFSAGEWGTFWEENERGFRPRRRAEKKKDDKPVRVVRKTGRTAVVEELKIPEFFGSEILSDRVVFVLDVSISMKDKDPVPPPGRGVSGRPGGSGSGSGNGSGGRTGVGDGKDKRRPRAGGGKGADDDDGLPTERMRIRRVQSELSRMLRTLPKDTQFTVISFNDEVKHYSSSLVKANRANKERAVKFVQTFNPKGETYTDRALEAAFKVPNVRTIFLLSDGGPFRDQKPINAVDIIDWVRNHNRFRRIQVNTVGFAAARAQVGNFLHILAYENNGTFTELP